MGALGFAVPVSSRWPLVLCPHTHIAWQVFVALLLIVSFFCNELHALARLVTHVASFVQDWVLVGLACSGGLALSVCASFPLTRLPCSPPFWPSPRRPCVPASCLPACPPGRSAPSLSSPRWFFSCALVYSSIYGWSKWGFASCIMLHPAHHKLDSRLLIVNSHATSSTR